MAILGYWDVTYNSLYAYIGDLDPEYWANYGTANVPRHTKYEIKIDDGAYRNAGKNSAIEGESNSLKFINLHSETTYTLTARITYITSDNVQEEVTLTEEVTTEVSPAPNPFEWWTEKVSGEEFNIEADEWNELIDKVNEFLIYRGMDPGYYPMSYVDSGDIFTANDFNRVRYAIGSMASTGIANKISGTSKITAADLNKIVDVLNSIE